MVFKDLDKLRNMKKQTVEAMQIAALVIQRAEKQLEESELFDSGEFWCSFDIAYDGDDPDEAELGLVGYGQRDGRWRIMCENDSGEEVTADAADAWQLRTMLCGIPEIVRTISDLVHENHMAAVSMLID